MYEGDTIEEQFKNIPQADWHVAMRYHQRCYEDGTCMLLVGVARDLAGGDRYDEDSLRRAGVILERMVRSNLAAATDTPSVFEPRSAFFSGWYWEGSEDEQPLD